ncbi:NAD-dependent epimerase/dehydratase family protein [Microbulbifer hydrolyticus]|uniref:NAD-dependent epimerase/dehydratase family protein n=1 Tax=Microbulbifer hydrolyticus TaxID=48074 RepID=A0A6P1T976_9GAMM|nr:NAD-dependent epimerase/dehydratase family protein [Microbulbifer hydrolyticus]MBB5210124.1 nucleoside-diphosphate-sugar epimerase [Microbulbifer hydrolyticus]QHQ39358.1 NAD-dependent epimerase/dehydratase family protein [Microbulbifer hydrolyticus]
MKILILGMGHVGKALGSRLRDNGHQVIGTTTTPEKVAALRPYADEVVVLKGHESDKVAAAAAGVDLIVVTVAPNVRNTRTPEERHQHYRQTLVETCSSAAASCERLIFLSSFSVYGDGGEGSSPITEETPTSNHEEPSSLYYQQAEQNILSRSGGCVLRFPDMYGAPGDLSFPERVKLAHSYFGGKALFGADALLYAIHFEDVVSAVAHAVDQRLSGIFNVCDNERIPATNARVFDAICDAEGLTRLEFLNQIKAPNRRISAEKIYATGYRVAHGDPNASYLREGETA